MPKKLDPRATLSWLMYTYKGNFIQAQEIWLYCYDHKLKVPDQVLAVFADGVRKHYEHQRTQHSTDSNNLYEQRLQDIKLYRYVRLWKLKTKGGRGFLANALNNFIGFHDGKYIKRRCDKTKRLPLKNESYDNLKQRYYRIRKLIKSGNIFI